MARTALQKVYADFRQGFVTVANPLAYPDGSVKDIVNFDIKDNGTLALRPGLRKETETTVDTGLSLSDVNNLALSVHVWNNVANEGTTKIAVVQVGASLYFYPMLDSGIDLDNPVDVDGVASGNPLVTGITSEGRSTTISTTSGSGFLFVAHPDIKPLRLEKSDDDTIVSEDIDIKIRDLELWEGETEQETGFIQGNTLYPQHEYNLRNGGWPNNAVVSKTEDANAGTLRFPDPVQYTKDKIGEYPKISIPFSSAKAGGGSSVNEQQAYNPWFIENDFFGKSTLPLGKFIVNAAEWTRSGQGVTSLSGTASPTLVKKYSWTQYPTSVEFYSGRVWYTGAKGYQEQLLFPPVGSVRKDDLEVSNTIYFSQQLNDNLNKVEKCYQENDPTAEDINQLLATDGGTLTIRGAGEIYDIKAFGTSLIVFASEGLWAISGVDRNSFTADSFSVDKITNIGPSSRTTVSATGNTIYYIANDALYLLTTDEVSGLPTAKDITSGRIKDFYNQIPYSSKEKAKAFFDESNRNLYIFYSQLTTPDLETDNISYNKCLVFNQDLGCFYKYTIPLNSHYIVDGLFYNKNQNVVLSEPITLDGTPVTLDGEPVVLERTYGTASLNNVQLLTVVDEANATLTFSSFTDITDKLDWGEEYDGYVEFGFDSAGDLLRDSKKAPVIITHMERTEDGFEEDGNGELQLTNGSSCLMSYGWDWASSYKNPQQIYRFNRHYIPSGTEDPFNYGVDVITTRNRIRGKGHSLGIRLDSESGKDCKLLGIGILYTTARDV